MKTTRRRVAVRNLSVSVFLLALLLTITACSGSYNGGGGGGGGTSPTITSLSPTSGAVGTSVTISGNYFGASQGSSTVTFNGTAATPTSWSNTSIVAPVPAGATTGYVVVTVGGVASNGVTFTVSGSGGGAGTGWTWIQDNPLIFCVQPSSTCTISSGEIAPTTAGSVWVLQVQTQTNVTITSVTGGGGSWVHCANCQVTNPSGFSADAWYNLSGNAGTTSGITFNLSGSSGTVLSANFYELLPPPGYTASLDTAGKATQSSCTTCSGPTLVLAATDAVIMNPGGAAAAGWNACSAPYITDANGSCIGLDVPVGSTTPTIKFTGSSNPEFMAIAFKSTLGNFTPPTHQYSVANFTAVAPAACGTCTLTIPATGTGHLLFIEAGDESFTHIISVSGGGTWSVPSGANTCQAQLAIAGQNNAASCAYDLSSSSGTTSITVSMSGSAATNFAIWEIATNTGAFTLDTQASITNNSNSFYPSGPALTLTGKNDVIFQLAWVVGGSLGPTYYPMPCIASNGSVGPFNYFLLNQVASAALLDSGPSAPPAVWINPQNSPTFATGVAFKTQ